MPGSSRQHQHDAGRHAERLRIAGELLHQRLVGGAADAGLRDQQARRGGDDQRRDLRDQAVADRQQRVGARGVGEAHALLGDADDDAADDVDEDDEQAGDRVAAHEFRGAVHGAEEAAFVLQLLAALLGGRLVDQAGGQVGVDRHLLAGHGVEVEAGGDFRDAARTLGDDDEVHDHQDREHDDADDEIAAHHEIAEGLDDVAGGRGALMPVRQDQPGRGQVERQPQHGRDQAGWSGTTENSSGAWMNSAVIRIRIDRMIEIARNRSSTIDGSGRISTTRMVRTPNASARSPRFRMLPMSTETRKSAARCSRPDPP